MTRKELDKFFAKDLYEGVRKYAKRIMDAHPEIDDAHVVLFAAGKMEECADDGVELGVDDALRLTAKHDPIPTAQDFMDTFAKGDIETMGDLLSLIEKGFENTPRAPENIPRSTAERATQLTRLGRSLADGNRNIVLMGIPADLTWGFTQLKLAFFTENLSDREQEIIGELKSIADRVKYTEEYGIGYAMFKIDLAK